MSGGGRVPNLLVIGAARAGTTSVWRYLSRHPDVFMAAPKEIEYFSADANFAKGSAWYGSHFRHASTQRYAGEASTAYLFVPAAAARMAELAPAARLIAVLRHPVERAYSHYLYRRLWRHEWRDFADAVRDEMATGEAPLGNEYLARGAYHAQLSRICAHFPRHALHVLLFDTLRDAPDDAYRDVCGFLELEPAGAVDVGEALNPSIVPRSRRVWWAMHRWRWRPGGRGRLVEWVDRHNVPDTPLPTMTTELREELLSWFAEDNVALGAWLGRALPETWWR